jgi:hypothetical protein
VVADGEVKPSEDGKPEEKAEEKKEEGEEKKEGEEEEAKEAEDLEEKEKQEAIKKQEERAEKVAQTCRNIHKHRHRLNLPSLHGPKSRQPIPVGNTPQLIGKLIHYKLIIRYCHRQGSKS